MAVAPLYFVTLLPAFLRQMYAHFIGIIQYILNLFLGGEGSKRMQQAGGGVITEALHKYPRHILGTMGTRGI